MKKVIILCAVIALITINAWADTIIFKSGKKIDGAIKNRDEKTVTVDLYGITEMTYDLGEIESINGQAISSKLSEAPPAEPVPSAQKDERSPIPGNSTRPEINNQEIPKEAITTPTQQEEDISGLSADEKKMVAEASEIIKKAKPLMEAAEPILSSMKRKESRLSSGETRKTGLLLDILGYIYFAICLQMIANKTGTENYWRAWLPFSNLFLMFEIAGIGGIWCCLFIICFVLAVIFPIVVLFVGVAGLLLGITAWLVVIVMLIFVWTRISVNRGKPAWLGILSVVPIVNTFVLGYLAFSK